MQEELFFFRGAETVKVQGVFLDAGVDQEGDLRRGFGQGVKGGQRDEDELPHAGHLHGDLAGGFVQEFAFQKADHFSTPGQRWWKKWHNPTARASAACSSATLSRKSCSTMSCTWGLEARP